MRGKVGRAFEVILVFDADASNVFELGEGNGFLDNIRAERITARVARVLPSLFYFCPGVKEVDTLRNNQDFRLSFRAEREISFCPARFLAKPLEMTTKRKP